LTLPYLTLPYLTLPYLKKKTRVTENNARHNLGYLKGKIFIYLYFIKKTSKSLFHQKKQD
ncbi:hypothetical protein, partial [Sphingobacterium sp.]|uniref:hypothetical protein n=1 Tax=Sphingobacterium sp. TaxID=341027 RepID=UPI0031D80B5F